MKKLNTEIAKKYVLTYLEGKNYMGLSLEDLVITRKYKNFNSMLCRDFYIKKINKSCILVENLDTSHLFIIDNANYELFINYVNEKNSWYFIPVITNDGLVFMFEEFKKSKKEFEEKQKILNFMLNKIFDKKHFFIPDEEFLIISFSNLDLTEIVSILEKNSIKFSQELSEKVIKSNKGNPITPDVALIYYRFPEYYSFNQEQAINELFSIVSKKKELKEKELSGIKILLRKINKNEFPAVKKIALSFKNNNTKELENIFEEEELKMKSKTLIDELKN